jgi:hypothetical protein
LHEKWGFRSCRRQLCCCSLKLVNPSTKPWYISEDVTQARCSTKGLSYDLPLLIERVHEPWYAVVDGFAADKVL